MGIWTVIPMWQAKKYLQDSLFPSCGSQGSNSHPPSWWQVPLTSESPHWLPRFECQKTHDINFTMKHICCSVVQWLPLTVCVQKRSSPEQKS
ncbi:hypothetical protein LEMLEM_LOCUS22673 [Lemmus lemmus]